MEYDSDQIDTTRPGAIDPASIKSILIIRTSALGDVIHTLPSLEALRLLFPRANISWLIEPLGAAILEGHPSLDKVHIMPRKRWARELRNPVKWGSVCRHLGAALGEIRRQKFDLVIDFQCNIRSGLAVLLSGGTYRLGFCREDCREWGGYLFTNIKSSPAPPIMNKVEKNLHLLHAIGWSGEPPAARLAIPEEDMEWARTVVAGLEGKGPVVTIHPTVSAFGAFKRWPAEHFRALCDRLENTLDARILLTWGPGEEDMARAIVRGTLAPPTPRLMKLAALIAVSDLFIAGDTGALHLAAVLKTPLIGLYGPKNPVIYGPYGFRGRLVRSDVPCSPCELRRCDHRICMTTLHPDTVHAAIHEVLDECRPAERVASSESRQ